MKKAGQLKKKLKELSEKVIPDRNRQGIFDWTASLSSHIFMVYSQVANAFEPLTQADEVKFEKTKAMIAEYLKDYNTLFETGVKDFKKSFRESEFSFFKPFKALSLDEADSEKKKKKKEDK